MVPESVAPLSADFTCVGFADQGEGRGEGGNTAGSTAPHLRWQADVGPNQLLEYPYSKKFQHLTECRVDDKSASEYGLEAGATLHLVLALRGGAAMGAK